MTSEPHCGLVVRGEVARRGHGASRRTRGASRWRPAVPVGGFSVTQELLSGKGCRSRAARTSSAERTRRCGEDSSAKNDRCGRGRSGRRAPRPPGSPGRGRRRRWRRRRRAWSRRPGAACPRPGSAWTAAGRCRAAPTSGAWGRRGPPGCCPSSAQRAVAGVALAVRRAAVGRGWSGPNAPVLAVEVGQRAGEVQPVGAVVGARPGDDDAPRRGTRRPAGGRAGSPRTPPRRPGSARAGRTRTGTVRAGSSTSSPRNRVGSAALIGGASARGRRRPRRPAPGRRPPSSAGPSFAGSVTVSAAQQP